MPWSTNAELPDHVKGVLPAAAQTRFRQVANARMKAGDDDKSAIKQAWSVVKQGWEKGDGGDWVRKAFDPNEPRDDSGKWTSGSAYSQGTKVPGGLKVSRKDDGLYWHTPKTGKSGGPFKNISELIIHAQDNSGLAIPDQPFDQDTLDQLKKAAPRTLYVCRYVQNAKDIIKWAKDQGFNTTVPADEMHVTITFSKKPVDWMKARQDTAYGPDGSSEVTVAEGGPRLVEPLGPGGAVVLLFSSWNLAWRHDQIQEDTGASWDFPGYQPHITITWDAQGIDLSKVEPYTGKIVLGPEIFQEVNDGYKDDLVEKLGEAIAKFDAINPNVRVVKVDATHGLVIGWAIICKHQGQDYFDLNRDQETGQPLPEHIPEDSMLEAATDFMENSRVAKEMHDGDKQGSVVFAFPMTSDIAKSLSIDTKGTTGLLIAMKPSPTMLAKFKSGELTGFSIGGSRKKVRQEVGVP